MPKCQVCNRDLTAGASFCPGCGAPNTRRSKGGYLLPHPLVAGAAVFGASAAVSIPAWSTLSLPTRFATSLIPVGSCSGIKEGTLLIYLSSMKFALLTLLGPPLVPAL